MPSMNTINIITCYWSDGTWCFDDPARGLLKEPFILGIDAILTRACFLAMPLVDVKKDGFRLTFSHQGFPGAAMTAERQEEDSGGYWYTVGGMRGWLCPALFKFYPEAPERIFFSVAPALR